MILFDWTDSIVATLLWIMKKARLALEIVISFLHTRASKSDQDDWESLGESSYA